MRTILLILSALIISACNRESPFNKNYAIENKPKTEAELKQELWQIECDNPLNYLKLESVIYEPLFGRAKLRCTVSNQATIATYKDFVITVEYMSITKAVIRSWDNTFYEYLEPQNQKTFEIGLFSYGDEVDKIYSKLKNAGAYKGE